MSFRLRFSFIVLVVLVVFLAFVFAKEKSRERVYDVPFEKLWSACIHVANERYVLTFSNKSDGVMSFKRRLSFRSNTWPMRIAVTLQSLNEKQTRITITPEQKPDLISKEFFAAVDDALREK